MKTKNEFLKNFKVEVPHFQDKYFSIEQFGAVAGGEVSNTEVIRKTIEEAVKQGGGHVVIPAGMWLTGPVELKSGIDLHLESGALLLFDKNKEEYPVQFTDYEGQPRIRAVSPITARNAENVAITGKGTIDGNGHLWRVVKKFKVTERQWKKMLESSDNVIPTKEGGMWFPTKSAYEGCLKGEPAVDEENALEKAAPYYDFLRPVMVNFIHCNKVLIDGVTLENSPNWNVHPLFCTNLTVRNATIRNPYHAQNGDGIDVESCHTVEIVNTKFDVGDDAICIKSGKNEVARKVKGPTENVYIHDCTVLHGHGGFVVGSEMSRGVKDVYVDNCTFIGTDTGIRFKSQLGRGGVVENIHMENINMLDIEEEAMIFTMGYSLYKMDHEQAENDVMQNMEDVPEFKNIEIENVTCRGAATGLKVEGLTVLPIHDIHLKNVSVSADRAYVISNGKNITAENVTFKSRTNTAESKVFTDCVVLQ